MEQGVRSETISSKPLVRVSHIWPGCIPEDEIQWRVTLTHYHTMVKVIVPNMLWHVAEATSSQQFGHTPSEGANGIKSRPKYDVSQHSVNAGSPALVQSLTHQYGDGVLIVPKSRPVMGTTVGNQSNPSHGNKRAVMQVNQRDHGGKENSFCIQLLTQKEDC